MAAPEREWMKAADVCEVVGVPAYVLRSWEAEFPQLGQEESGGGARLYGPDDVELVRRIRTLVFDEGLTLAGVRRQIEGRQGTAGPVTPRRPPVWDTDTTARVKAVRDGLRELLGRLESRPSPELELVPSAPPPRRKARVRRTSGPTPPVASE
jgi:DNA-binding transcriptional MerR regulator